MSGAGCGMLLYPLMFDALLDHFDWRQAMLITGAITLNLCVCAAVVFPLRKDLNVNVVKRNKMLRVSMLKKQGFTKLCINNLLFCVALSITYVHLPAYANSVGHTEHRAAMLVSATGIANCIGRLAYGLLAHHPKLAPLRLYVTSFLLLGIVTLFVPLSTEYYFIVAYCVALGFLSATLGCLLPLLLVEFLGLHRMANGYGFLLIYEAVGSLLGAPAAGKR